MKNNQMLQRVLSRLTTTSSVPALDLYNRNMGKLFDPIFCTFTARENKDGIKFEWINVPNAVVENMEDPLSFSTTVAFVAFQLDYSSNIALPVFASPMILHNDAVQLNEIVGSSFDNTIQKLGNWFQLNERALNQMALAH